MAMDFTDIMRKIIGVNELGNFDEVARKLEDIEEGFIFQDNRPTHVIMTLDKYEQIISNVRIENKPSINTTAESLETLLNKIGKRVFIEYYEVFKADENAEQVLKERCGFSIASCRSRCSSARSIFRNNMQIEALSSIENSSRVEPEIATRAKELLEMERGSGVSVINSAMFSENEEYDVKIGKMMRGIVSKLIQNNMLSSSTIEQMQTAEYSKNVFNLNFPVLKIVKAGEIKDEVKRDAKGYNRYYGDSVWFDDREYLICSQWVDNLHKDYAEKWVLDELVNVLLKLVDKIPSGTEFCVRDVLSDYWPYVGWSMRIRVGHGYKNALDKNTIEATEKKTEGQYYRKK